MYHNVINTRTGELIAEGFTLNEAIAIIKEEIELSNHQYTADDFVIKRIIND